MIQPATAMVAVMVAMPAAISHNQLGQLRRRKAIVEHSSSYPERLALMTASIRMFFSSLVTPYED
jgi:hypothetical protein